MRNAVHAFFSYNIIIFVLFNVIMETTADERRYPVGFVMSAQGFDQVISELQKEYRVFAPVCKKGAGRYTDTDVVMYDEITGIS